MPAFEYRALNSKGKEERGIIEGDTSRQVRQALRNRELTPLEVQAVIKKHKETATGVMSRPLFGGGLSPTDLALVTRQLATLIGSGSPIEEALNSIVRQSENGSMRRIISAVRSKVLEGHTLANALGQFPHAFPALYRATVGAGEKSGHLEQVLERLADYTENRQLSQQKVSSALAYPILLSVVSIGIVIALLKFVVPNVIKVFDTFNHELPLLTRLLIKSSQFLENYGTALLIGIVGIAFLILLLLKQESWKMRFQRWQLKIPVIGRLVRSTNSERFARTLSILASSGVPIIDAMHIAAEVVSNLPMRQAILEAAARVREGTSIYKALEKSTLFPPMMIYLIASGEGSGRLEQMLERAATQQEREIQARLATFVGLLEPALILLMGGIVTLIVLAIMLPILNMPQLVR
ncbi:type II secretion system inner membrane protein GspF [Thiofilum flexile]|uniref:type II secretion system inner membrane protein GspF n=1 Tax=Thiofilum flexile TaxID=125627 RepID=UPI000374C732|nr:type II secretion system inner membrane protein GspF [Thiofilum flexile]